MLLAGAVGIAGLAIMMWPFFSVLDLLTATGDFDSINSRTYRRVAIRSVLAVPGLAILATRLARRQRDPLALAGLAVTSVFVFGWVTDRGSLGRVFPGCNDHGARPDGRLVRRTVRKPIMGFTPCQNPCPGRGGGHRADRCGGNRHRLDPRCPARHPAQSLGKRREAPVRRRAVPVIRRPHPTRRRRCCSRCSVPRHRRPHGEGDRLHHSGALRHGQRASIGGRHDDPRSRNAVCAAAGTDGQVPVHLAGGRRRRGQRPCPRPARIGSSRQPNRLHRHPPHRSHRRSGRP